MTEYTPTTTAIRNKYALWSRRVGGNQWDDSMAEFDRWLDAHDQCIRDAVKPPELTAKEHLEAAFEAANPVPANGRIPKGTKYLTRCGGQDVVTAEAGIDLRGGPDIRTLTPLPPLIPEGTPAVWASTSDDREIRPLVLSTEFPAMSTRYWRDGDGSSYTDSQLIDPVPIHKEGER